MTKISRTVVTYDVKLPTGEVVQGISEDSIGEYIKAYTRAYGVNQFSVDKRYTNYTMDLDRFIDSSEVDTKKSKVENITL